MTVTPTTDGGVAPPRRFDAARRFARNVRRAAGIVLRRNPVVLAGNVVLELVGTADTLGTLYAAKKVIDSIVASARDPAHPLGAVAFWIAVELCLFVLRGVIQQLTLWLQLSRGAAFEVYMRGVVLEKATRIPYRHFEDPEFLNRLAVVKHLSPMSTLSTMLGMMRNVATLTGAAALLVALGGWGAAAMIVAAIPPFLYDLHASKTLHALQADLAGKGRLAQYLESLVVSEHAVKEIKLLTIGEWLVEQVRASMGVANRARLSVTLRQSRMTFLTRLVSELVFYSAYAYVALRAATGAISVGAIAVYMATFKLGSAQVTGALAIVSQVYRANLNLEMLFAFLDMPEEAGGSSAPFDAPPPRTPATVVFDRVTFRYPGAATDTLADVSLTLRAGETVALVGRNGSGKTTLVKLLTGLYRPTSGRILVDGVDVATIDVAELRQRFAVVFQDFVKFQLTARDNVGLGWLPSRDDARAIERALAEADASHIVASLPEGLDTRLGRAFGGSELSGGQWQRVALARAAMRRSQIVVLDEPTAALDPEAEHEIFQRFAEIKGQRTTLLITHRFSTIHMADRIIVLERGRVAEEGSHEALLAAKGRYATMFNLQARAFVPRNSEPS